MQGDIQKGDRVRLVPSAAWSQPYRGWAERERMGTVDNVFTPQGSNRAVVTVRFDRARTKRLEHFSPRDLIKIDPTP